MIWTGTKSRELMYGLLERFVVEHKESFVGQYVIGDLMKLVRTKTGKVEAQVGFHDDSIMSFNMCLYLYYYGNNLNRYGFIRGVVPDEKEQNQGMDYTELYANLSEKDREFFGITPENDPSLLIPDMKSVIESSRGLIDEKELKAGLREENDINKNVKQPSIMNLDPYSRKIYQEMQRAEQESASINKRIRSTTSYRNLNDDEMDDGDDFDSSLFTYLND